MKELDVFLKTVVEGMKTMAEGIEVLAGKLETIAKSRGDVAPKRKAKAKVARKSPAKSSKKKVPQKASKRAVSKKATSPTAVDTRPPPQWIPYLGLSIDQKKVLILQPLWKKRGIIKRRLPTWSSN